MDNIQETDRLLLEVCQTNTTIQQKFNQLDFTQLHYDGLSTRKYLQEDLKARVKTLEEKQVHRGDVIRNAVGQIKQLQADLNGISVEGIAYQQTKELEDTHDTLDGKSNKSARSKTSTCDNAKGVNINNDDTHSLTGHLTDVNVYKIRLDEHADANCSSVEHDMVNDSALSPTFNRDTDIAIDTLHTGSNIYTNTINITHDIHHDKLITSSDIPADTITLGSDTFHETLNMGSDIPHAVLHMRSDIPIDSRKADSDTHIDSVCSGSDIPVNTIYLSSDISTDTIADGRRQRVLLEKNQFTKFVTTDIPQTVKKDEKKCVLS